MEALLASYGDASSDSDSNSSSQRPSLADSSDSNPLPPPPLSLLNPLNSLGTLDFPRTSQTSRIRSFPHVDGNYALHVYIPVHIPPQSKKELALFLRKVTLHEQSLHVVDVDVPLNILCKSNEKFEDVTLGREFHISLGRTVPIRVHQIDSIVSMLQQKLQTQRKYMIDFSKWEVFVNDDHTRTFLSLEILDGGLTEIRKQIQVVNAVYKLHNLPEFYEDPRPHISVAWALGDIGNSLKRIVQEEELKGFTRGRSLKKCLFSSKFNGIVCKIGKKIYKVC
ncbi:U6 snRNA phosphodiesterase [Quillaja saponaria]|uniref:U6 snRNA phosphodiesterase n=1 Tax=Quillaja saponaria TaxID=32244 RepID=A0AAD7L175_QUISA|nr:U6 snRNA phosphodiesterase [Quillaja saponaria]